MKRLDDYEKDLIDVAGKVLGNGEQKKFLIIHGKKQAVEDFRKILEEERTREP